MAQSGEVDSSEASQGSWHLEAGEPWVLDDDVLGALARIAVDGEHALEAGWAVVAGHGGENHKESRNW